MTEAQRIDSGNAINQLRNNPMAFLRATPLVIGGGLGADTSDEVFSFALDGGRGRLGRDAHIRAVAPPDSVIAGLNVHTTPMRLRTAGSARWAATRRVPVAGRTRLWLTTQLTGCSVLLMDWGATLSMVHLEPYRVNDYAVCFRPRGDRPAQQASIRATLRAELTSAVRYTSYFSRPARYILVETLGTQHYVALLGVRDERRGWSFYLQQYVGAVVHRARQLDWVVWSQADYVPVVL